MKRRNFLRTGGLATAAIPVMAGTLQPFSYNGKQLENDREKVNFTRDGLDLTVLEYADLLTQIESSVQIEPDYYSRGGIVEILENRMADILGKESAVFMPTGTLANHLAVRKLAGEKRKVIVQAESHIYRDSGDCASNLSGLNLIPLGKNKVEFNLTQVEEVIRRASEERVETGVGVIVIESPVRRQYNRMFDFAQIEQISGFARDHQIKMHMDGARLFNACVHSKKSPTEFACLFDTVYVSLYKNFNAASGAILAGNREFTEELYHTRRMFGGGMPQVWPFAAVALHYLNGFLQSYKESLDHAGSFFDHLRKSNKFEIRELKSGTNVVRLRLKDLSPGQLQKSLELQNIYIPNGDEETGEIFLKINPSILRKSPEVLARIFINHFQ